MCGAGRAQRRPGRCGAGRAHGNGLSLAAHDLRTLLGLHTHPACASGCSPPPPIPPHPPTHPVLPTCTANLYRTALQVRCGAVPPLSAQPLEVPEDCGQQAVRVHARDAPGRAGARPRPLGVLSMLRPPAGRAFHSSLGGGAGQCAMRPCACVQAGASAPIQGGSGCPGALQGTYPGRPPWQAGEPLPHRLLAAKLS